MLLSEYYDVLLLYHKPKLNARKNTGFSTSICLLFYFCRCYSFVNSGTFIVLFSGRREWGAGASAAVIHIGYAVTFTYILHPSHRNCRSTYVLFSKNEV